MAIATTTCTCLNCGAEFVHRAKKRNRTDADNYAAWAAANIDLCPACYHAQMREQQAAENAQKAEAFRLPTLSGSPKQITWADDLRLMFAAGASDLCGDDSLMRQGVQVVLDRKLSAKWWIDHRFDVDYAAGLLNHIINSTDPEDVALTKSINAIAAQKEDQQ